MSKVQMPSVGRKLWFFTSAQHALEWAGGKHQSQPFDATVTFVHSERCVNVRVCDHTGTTNMGLGIALRQPDDPPHNGPHCQWMPYQQAQHAKHNAEEIVEIKGHPVLDLSLMSSLSEQPKVDVIAQAGADAKESAKEEAQNSVDTANTPASGVDSPGTKL